MRRVLCLCRHIDANVHVSIFENRIFLSALFRNVFHVFVLMMDIWGDF